MRTNIARGDVRGHAIRAIVFAAGAILLSTPSFAQVGVSVRIAPPEMPVYEQPMAPGDGYLWTPGYWGWANDDYYWSPGTWVMPPEVGFLWTPGYWGWGGAGFMFNDGYWGPTVGFYGGIDYGFGYFGNGYEGGRWEGGRFFYNTSLNRVANGSACCVFPFLFRDMLGIYRRALRGVQTHPGQPYPFSATKECLPLSLCSRTQCGCTSSRNHTPLRFRPVSELPEIQAFPADLEDESQFRAG